MKKIAIVLSLVFVISIALVACFAFVPMSARQVASAAENSFVAGDLYTVTYYSYGLGLSAPQAVDFTSSIDCYGAVIPYGSTFDYDINSMVHFVEIYKKYNNPTSNYFLFRQNPGVQTAGDWRFMWSDTYSYLQFYVYNGSSFDVYSQNITVYFGSGYYDWDSDYINIGTFIDYFVQILNLNRSDFFPLPSDEPVLDDNRKQ